MQYLTFGDSDITDPDTTFDIAILVPRLHRDDINKHYIEPYLSNYSDRIIACHLHKEGKKTPVKIQKEFLEDLIPELQDLKIKYLIVCDADYAKLLTKLSSIEPSLGYVLDSAVGDFKIIYCPNYQQVFYDPDKVGTKINRALTALTDHIGSNYQIPGDGIIHFADYPKTTEHIALWLQRLLNWDLPLTADIECFSLKHWDGGIGSICLCWSLHEGIAFPVDLSDDPPAVRALLKDFFMKFANKLIWHNINFDVYILVYQLFMDHLLDTEGLLHGLSVMLKNWEDTKLISYLATNTCAGNELGLKIQAQEFAGNYAIEEIKDIRKIPLDDLLQYNLIDGLSTWYVLEKHWQTLQDDNQVEIYENLFKPAIWDIIQMQLTGLPLDMDKVKEVEIQLQAEVDQALQSLNQTNVVQEFIYELNVKAVEKKNSKWKKKRITLEEQLALPDAEIFNPNSNPQLQDLIYGEDWLHFEVLDRSKSKLPSTKRVHIEKLVHLTEDPDQLAFLNALIDYKNVFIILNTFIPAFLKAPQAPDGYYYLFGNFNLGGTLSGRLSSSDPNLQNIPATQSKYAKLIKSCFSAPPGYLFVGLDFASLEDRISALTTRDPNKLKVYTDGYDGHCLRALAYFPDQITGIDENNVAAVNSIAKIWPELRQKGKNPTFALTYQGTFRTLMTNYNFSLELATTVTGAYHTLYKVSSDYIQTKLKQAETDGYVTCAFGLRVRTPLMKQTILGNKKTPFEAAAEGRTAGNALGQSWCMLNMRAMSEFMFKVRDSNYKLDIRPCAQIHDATYYLVRDDVELIHWMNTHLVEAVQWQYDPEIAHPLVKLGGELGIFYPNWATELVIPNGASEEEITNLSESHYKKVNK